MASNIPLSRSIPRIPSDAFSYVVGSRGLTGSNVTWPMPTWTITGNSFGAYGHTVTIPSVIRNGITKDADGFFIIEVRTIWGEYITLRRGDSVIIVGREDTKGNEVVFLWVHWDDDHNFLFEYREKIAERWWSNSRFDKYTLTGIKRFWNVRLDENVFKLVNWARDYWNIRALDALSPEQRAWVI